MSASPRRPRWASVPHAVAITAVLLVLAPRAVDARFASELSPSDLKQLSLEELMGIEVTTVSRRPEKLSETASAIQVITAEDIRRSGATRLPEVLRLASNLQVAQFNAHDWAISARGFNGAPLANNSLANKLLVMIDGRTVYTPLFAGVFWDVQNVFLEDVERIEVVSGPGGTLWGANAVNGVINVVTRSARDTQGIVATARGGTFLHGYGGGRAGGEVAPDLFVRGYVQHVDHGPTDLGTGEEWADDWRMTQGGFRLDWHPDEGSQVTLQGDAYDGRETLDPDDTTLDGQNLLGRVTHAFSDGNEVRVQLYVDRTWRDLHAPTFFRHQLTTTDIDLQHRIGIGSGGSVVYGVGYRYMETDATDAPTLAFDPDERTMSLVNGFAQLDLALVPGRLDVVLGTKIEQHEYYDDPELQPSARAAWLLTSRQTLWGAVSRAVRAPSRFDADLVIPLPGDPDFRPEEVIAYELGYRIRAGEQVTLSINGFRNDYEDLRGVAATLSFANAYAATSEGVEIFADIQARPWWRLHLGFTHLSLEFDETDVPVVDGSETIEAVDPENQFYLRSRMDLPGQIELDVLARFIGEIPGTVLPTEEVPGYETVDVRLARRFGGVEVGVVGRNLIEPRHPEFGVLEIPRSVYGVVTWRR